MQSFIRQDAVLQRFTQFFRGESSGRLFVFYQPPAVEGEVSWSCSARLNNWSENILQQGWSEGAGPKELSISDGNHGLMVHKCCYFVRNLQPGAPLDLTKSGDADLLFGELGDSVLGTIEAILSQSYRPMLDTYDNWGKVDDEQKKDFIDEIGSFINNINEALLSFASGLELRAPDPKIYRALEVKSHRTTLPSEAVDHFEVLLNEWCNQIERYLDMPMHTSSENEDVGPRGELEHWRGRMQKLTSITEQLKR